MAASTELMDKMPVVRNIAEFDPKSGSALERLIFNHRLAVMLFCLAVTLLLAAGAAMKLTLNASFEKMIPQSHPTIKNYLDNRNELRGLGNALRIVVENTKGDIFDPKYQEVLRKINDELFLTPGVDRAWLKSLWTPGVRWTEVTEEGFRGGPVMPESYDGSPKAIEQLRLNIARAGIVGRFVGNDFKSSMIFVPLLDQDASGQPIDYRAFSRTLEDKIRAKFEHKLIAARYTFRRLFLAGMTALLADAVGFAVLMVIDIWR